MTACESPHVSVRISLVRSLFVVLNALIACFARSSAADTYWVRPAPHGQNYSDVQCFPEGVAWTAADGGRVARSDDYGTNWTLIPQFKPVDHPLSAVGFASPTRGLVATHRALGGARRPVDSLDRARCDRARSARAVGEVPSVLGVPSSGSTIRRGHARRVGMTP